MHSTRRRPTTFSSASRNWKRSAADEARFHRSQGSGRGAGNSADHPDRFGHRFAERGRILSLSFAIFKFVRRRQSRLYLAFPNWILRGTLAQAAGKVIRAWDQYSAGGRGADSEFYSGRPAGDSKLCPEGWAGAGGGR